MTEPGVSGIRRTPGPTEPPNGLSGRRRRSVSDVVDTKLGRTFAGLVGVAAFLVAWHIVYQLELVAPAFFAKPTDVISRLVELLGMSEFWSDVRVSLKELMWGIGIALVAGIAIGVVYGVSPIARALMSPIVLGWNATPQIALVPILILWFGVGTASKVAAIVLSVITTLILNTATGIQTQEAKAVRMATSFGAGPWQLMRTVSLPHALPYIVTGIRLAIGRGLIALVVAELFASRAGLGNRLGLASNSFRTEDVFAVILVISSFGIILSALVTRLERRLAPWRS
jgi:NitT/TauT family transport system permease protein